MARESKIIIAKNIKIDKEYKEVLDYTEAQMLSLVETNAVASALDYSFVRDKGTISTNFTYNQALQCNYMAFQNKDYSNKWFFAWIEDVRYVNDGTTEISYTIDSWSTWFEKLNVGQSFVIREHVNDDTVGLHTLPEDVETGEYIINDIGRFDLEDLTLSNTDICMGVSWTPTNIQEDNRQYGGVYSGLTYFIFTDATSCSLMCKAYDDLSKADAIQTIFLIPRAFEDALELEFNTYTLGNQSGIVLAIPPSTPYSTPFITGYEITSPSSLNGYTPKNNKLKCWPYNYLYITNNTGIDVTYNYEDFINNTPTFNIHGVITQGGSLRLFPTKYKKYNTLSNEQSCFGMSASKYPTCSWNTDPYTNWLTQNAVNVALDVAGGAVSLVGSSLSGNVGGAIGSGMSIAKSINQVYQHALIPTQAKGNINSGDVIQGMRVNTFTYYKMSIKDEYARIVDDYFTRYGYKVNRLKVPNITGRTYWNYIQIASEDNLGSGEIPQKFMDEINRIARQGTTIWHNHNNIGNYSLDNAIV